MVHFAKPISMKTIISLLLLLLALTSLSQSSTNQNVFIITTDGFRWQEIFKGADSILINDPKFVKDTNLIKQLYWHETIEGRRQKLLPFFWNVIAKQGQLYGNRDFENKVNVKNIWKISYPGYNEILTGYADPLPMLNKPWNNPNETILECLHKGVEYEGKVAAFASWNIFPFILNSSRNKQFINSGYQHMLNEDSEIYGWINTLQDSLKRGRSTRYDMLTFMNATQYIKDHHPKVVFISLGETDEYAHKQQYDHYLQAANNVDRILGELWYHTQTDPFYKNNTSFLITTDHGRGAKSNNWQKHNFFTKGSGEVWLALIGSGTAPVGEQTTRQKIFLNQMAATIALLLGKDYQPSHSVAKPITLTTLNANIVTAPVAFDKAQ